MITAKDIQFKEGRSGPYDAIEGQVTITRVEVIDPHAKITYPRMEEYARERLTECLLRSVYDKPLHLMRNIAAKIEDSEKRHNAFQEIERLSREVGI